MASDDALFGAHSSASLDGLPAFFTNGNVDDGKYESLLADLRAHDLLGPVETGAQASDASGSSLFFNDAFSAVFMGNFQSNAGQEPATTQPAAATSGGAAARAPPGFSRAPPGMAPSETDLSWARGQQTFSRLEEKFQDHSGSASASTTTVKGRVPPPGLSMEQEPELDESQVPGLRGLGLDDDDSVASPVSSQTPPPPPLPPAAPSPPLPPTEAPRPPNAWGAAPQQPPYAPPPPQMPMYMSGPPLPPPQGMYGRGPPPPPQFYGRGPPPPLMHPPFPGPPGGYGRPGFPPPPHIQPPSFKMMTPRDVNFVMQQQMKQLRSSDPFSDDYYFHNYMQKRSRGSGSGANGGPGRPPALPLPSWKLQHVKSIDPRDAQREVKSRNWETEFHVLGRNAKSSLYRPKQLLNLSGAEAPASAETADPERTPSSDQESEQKATSPASESSSEAASAKRVPGSSPGAQAVAAAASAAKVLRMSDDASRNSVFANDTWTLRLQLDRGMQCLLSLQDARHLLDARGINVQQFHSLDASEMDPALAELRTRTTSLLLELAALLGVNVTPVEVDEGGQTDASTASARSMMSCDVHQLRKMLSAAKGKMLVGRALPLLHPSARFVLLPYLVDHLLSGRTLGGPHATDSNDAGDDRLCQTLVLMLLYIPPPPSAELLTECLRRALDAHDQQTLAAVLHNRARAEALQALLQRGAAAVQQLLETDPGEHSSGVKAQWERLQGVFVALATAIKRTA
ncbi:hypothetical protein BBJ28_00006621 [Nothophytophthora sp. Chile5]|nr:hypothetical protein BBJ28_00006621 [Nothophytophthora sp. Chile5]